MADKKDKRPLGVQLAERGLRDCLATPQGRAFLWQELEGAGLFRMSADVTSPSLTFFREGERNRANRLLVAIQTVSIDGFLLMQKEAFVRAMGNERATERNRNAEYGHGTDADADAGDGDAS
jgi:hypothetical protein